MTGRQGLHPQAAAHLDRVAAAGVPPVHTLSPEQARQVTDRGAPLLAGPPPAVDSVMGVHIPGPEDVLPARVYRATDVRSSPAVVWLHGGGWVVGNVDTHDVLCRRLSLAGACTVISVGYRLAPEHAFPAAVSDALAATRWVLDHHTELRIRRDACVVGGDSAGGTLATVVARHLTDEQPPLLGQVLVYPVTDHRGDTGSYRDLADGYLLTAEDMRWFWDHYVPDSAQRDHPDASPLRARDLAESPPAYVVLASHDVLRDEGLAYAERLRAAGVPVETRIVDGHLHGFLRWTAVVDAASAEIERIGAVLCRWWGL